MELKTQLNWFEQCSFCFKTDKSSLQLFSLRYLCRQLKIEFKQLFFNCARKAGSEHGLLEVQTDLDKAEVILCLECGKMIEKLSELFQSLEKIQMEVDWWLKGVREVINESEKKSEYSKGGGKINSIWAEVIKEVRRSVVDKPVRLPTLKPTLRLKRCMDYPVKTELEDDMSSWKPEPSEAFAEMFEDIFPQKEVGKSSTTFTPDTGGQSSILRRRSRGRPRKDSSKDVKASTKIIPNKIIKNGIRLGSNLIKCNQCSRTFTGSCNFQKHFRAAHIKKEMFQCHLCPIQYSHRGLLSNHLVDEHGSKDNEATFQCDIGDCDFKTFDSWHFKRHQLKCKGKRLERPAKAKKYKCDFCEEKFHTIRVLKRHTRLIHKVEQQKQKGRIIANGIVLKGELGQKKKVQCKICQRIFSDSCGFNGHYKSAHLGEIHQCYLCGKEYPRSDHLNGHLRRAHGIEPRIGREAPQVFKCDNGDCNYSTREKQLMKCHRIACQGIRKEPKVVKFKCEICGKGFGTEFHMKLHKSRVHSDKVFKCDECGKAVKRKETLKHHIESVHLKIRHKCDHLGCDKTYADKQLFSLHVRSCEKPPPPSVPNLGFEELLQGAVTE